MLERIGRVVTRGRRFIPQVDGLRFVAITTVVLYHIAHEVLDHGHGSGRPGAPLASSTRPAGMGFGSSSR